MKSNHPLEKITLLQGLPDHELRQIEDASSFQTFEADRQIIAEDDQTNDMFFILSGQVAIKSFSDTGYEVLYTELSAGDCFGEFSAIDGKPRAANVFALTKVIVARLPAVQFKSFVRRFPALGMALSEYLVKLARDLSERIFELSTLSVRARLKVELLRLAQAAPMGVDTFLIAPAPTHHQLAARISTHREAISRELAYLEANRLIVVGRQRIEIASIKALRQANVI